jgi:hypothetical protein
LNKLLIAVKSCQNDAAQGCHQIIRETWGLNTLLADLYFFVGRDGACPMHKSDEIHLLNTPDDYDGLPRKTQSILIWSLREGYDYTFLCDVDTFLIPSKLMKTDFQKFDYSGRIGIEHKLGVPFRYKDGRGQIRPKCYAWASGGFGYFLSRKAAEHVVNAVIDPKEWAEDVFVGDVLGPKIAFGEITAGNLDNFENEASWHYPAHRLGWTRERMKLWMHEMYKEHFNDR